MDDSTGRDSFLVAGGQGLAFTLRKVMIPLPIAYREMLVTARSRTLYRGRVILSLMVLLAGMALAALHQFAGVPPPWRSA